MSSITGRICRLCFMCISKNFVIIEGSIKEMLDFLLLKVNLSLSEEPVICENCAASVRTYFDLKSSWISPENSILPFVTASVGAKVDLTSTSFNTNEDLVTEDCNICRLCVKYVKKVNCMTLDMLMETKVLPEDMFAKCIPELNLENVEKSVICTICLDNLMSYYNFFTKCWDLEDKVTKYVKVEGTNNKGHVELSNVVQFLSSNSWQPNIDHCDIKEMKMEVDDVENEEINNVEINDESWVKIEDRELVIKDDEVREDVEKNYSDRMVSRSQKILSIDLQATNRPDLNNVGNNDTIFLDINDKENCENKEQLIYTPVQNGNEEEFRYSSMFDLTHKSSSRASLNLEVEHGKRRVQKKIHKKQLSKKRTLGLAYMKYKGENKPKTAMLPNPCEGKRCTNNCNTFSDNERYNLYKRFWKMANDTEQKFFINSCIQIKPIKRKRTSNMISRRHHTCQYFFTKNDGIQSKVCLQFFLATLGIKQRVIRKALTATPYLSHGSDTCSQFSVVKDETQELANHSSNSANDSEDITLSSSLGSTPSLSLEYMDYKGENKPKTAMLPNPCEGKRCTNNCNTFSDTERYDLHRRFWKMANNTEQKQFITSCIQIKPIKRKRTTNMISRRHHTCQYFLIKNGGTQSKVCLQFFLATLGIKQRVIRRALMATPYLTRASDTNTCSQFSVVKDETQELVNYSSNSANDSEDITLSSSLASTPSLSLEYMDYKGENKPKRTMLPNPCEGKRCTNNCNTFSDNERYDLYKRFWNMANNTEQKQFISSCIQIKPIKRKRTSNMISRRHHTCQYFFTKNDGTQSKVCLQFFLATLGISQRVIRRVLTGKVDRIKGGRDKHNPPHKIEENKITDS